jgi:hypothetical protein
MLENKNHGGRVLHVPSWSPVSTRVPELTTKLVAEEEDSPTTSKKCSKCERSMEIESSTDRPSWRELFYGEHQPTWWRNDESG